MRVERTFFSGAWWQAVLCLLLAGSFAVPRCPAQDLEATREQFRRGEYKKVIDTAKKVVESGTNNDGWPILLVQSLLTVGRYGEAYSNAVEGVNDFRNNIRLRLLARETALYQNDTRGAARRLEEIRNLVESRLRTYRDGPSLVAAGEALMLLDVEPRLVLQNFFQRAQKMEPAPREAFLATGQLALEKHDFAMAADTFRAGLAKYPKDADMQAGLARAFESGDRKQMLVALDDALENNPNHIPSLLLLADHMIDAEEYEEADKQLATVLEVNPNHPEALAYRGLLAHLRNDYTRELELRAAALKYWRTNPRVDYLIGLKLSDKYRFAEGAAAQRRALVFEPNYLPARRQLAQDLLRLGEDREGWDLVNAVHNEDGYDVTAYNLVTLRDQMAKYQTISNDHFIVRMSPREAQLYGDRALKLLERARETLTAKYGQELTRRTVVEIFAEQKDFAVRTFGIPGNPGYLGVCFGTVITANSPASQAPNPANWEAVLWHEFCHVVTLNATSNRMPRWLSEGMSVYEELQANPTWGQSMNLDYREMIQNGELTPVGELSGMFLAPKSPKHLQFAYYESALAVEFLVQRYGIDALKNILRDLRAGEEINKAIATRAAPLPQIEKEFAAFARDRAEKLAPGVDLDKPPTAAAGPRSGIGSVLRLPAANDPESWQLLHPKNYYVRLQKAVELMKEKKWEEAKPTLEWLVESYHGEKGANNPLWLLAVTLRNLGDTEGERKALEQFAQQEDDFLDLDLRLIELAQERNDWPAATQNAERLLAVNPLLTTPWRTLAEAGVVLGQNDQAIEAYRKLLLLDPPDPAEVHYQLARLLQARGTDKAEAKLQVLLALEEAPRYRDAQRLLLELHQTDSTQPTATPQPPASTGVSSSTTPMMP